MNQLNISTGVLTSKCRRSTSIVEEDRGTGTQENRGGRWAGSGRRRSRMRESCEGGRREKNERH